MDDIPWFPSGTLWMSDGNSLEMSYFLSVVVVAGLTFFFGLETPKLPLMIFPLLVLLSPLPILYYFGVALPLDE